MNEQIKEQALLAVKDLAIMTKEGILSGTKILQTQFPELCEQIIKVEIMYCLTWLLFGLILLVVSIILGIVSIKALKKYTSNYNPGLDMLIVFSVIAATSSLCFILPNLFWLGKCVMAPKIYLMEYFAALIK